MTGRLNIFQRTMLGWNEQHPYNSVHVAQVFAPLDAPRLAAAINRALQSRGIGSLVLDAERGKFTYRSGGADCEIKKVDAGENPLAELAAEVARQLNTPFPHRQEFNPIRFFLQPGNDFFLLGLVFFHAACDGTAAVELLAGIVDAYLGEPVPAPALNLYPPNHDAILFRDPGLFVSKVAAMVADFFALRSVRRVPGGAAPDPATAVTFFSLPAAEWAALQGAGKAWAVTINDLFLALLLQSFARQWPPPPTSHRTKLAVGCIVNLRTEPGLVANSTFGLFLGSLVVTCEPQPGTNLRELAQLVCQQTARIKRRRLAAATALEIRFARWVRGFYSPERQRKFYLKHYPLWGGISNLNLEALWPRTANQPRVAYFRAVSPGPVTPLVLSITTFGDGVNLGLAYRRAVFSDAQVTQIKRDFLAAVRDLSPA